MIIFRELEAKNFGPFRHLQMELDAPGSYLLDGQNGTGKSTVPELLSWILYKASPRLGANPADAVIYRHDPKAVAYGSITFERNGIEARVIRTRKAGSGRVRFFIDGVEKTRGNSDANTTEAIEKFLGMDWMLFQQIVLGGVVKFALLSEREQRRLIEAVVGVGRFDAIHSEVDRRVIREEQSLDSYQRDIDLRMNRLGILGEELGEEPVDLFRRVPVLPRPTPPSNEPLRIAEKRMETAAELYQEAKRELKNGLADIERCKRDVQTAKKFCPLCLRKNMPADRFRLLKEHLLRSHRAEFGLRKAEDQARVDFLAAKKHYLKVREALEQLNERFDKDGQQYERASKILWSINHAQKNREHLLQRRKTIKKELRECREMYSQNAHRLRGLQFWQKAFGPDGIRANLLVEFAEKISQRATDIAREIFHHSYQIQIQTLTPLKNGTFKERFNVHVESASGGGSYSALSSGERCRVDLCINRAFESIAAEQGVELPTLRFYDEVFSNLDAEGSALVRDLIEQDGKSHCNIVISHDLRLRSTFTRGWAIQKEGKTSTLTLKK